ncbi:MAG: hypothetical protein U0R77_01185 [Mycolicibacterium insubricum]
MRTLHRLLVVLLCATVGLLTGMPTASAGMDNSNTLVDGHDRTLVIEQWDTFLNGVFPVDIIRTAVSNAHGTVTPRVLLRPFARLIANTGDSVTTYGEPWNMN